jgi:hypothetical protein
VTGACTLIAGVAVATARGKNYVWITIPVARVVVVVCIATVAPSAVRCYAVDASLRVDMVGVLTGWRRSVVAGGAIQRGGCLPSISIRRNVLWQKVPHVAANVVAGRVGIRVVVNACNSDSIPGATEVYGSGTVGHAVAIVAVVAACSQNVYVVAVLVVGVIGVAMQRWIASVARICIGLCTIWHAVIARGVTGIAAC